MTINDLKTYGANTSEGLQRCMNNESLYLKLVKMIPGDSSFQKLYDAIDSNDLGTAFNAAHALKGSTGNLALTPVFEPVSEITELLRAGTQTDYTALIARIRKGRDELARICGD
ncbi:MAG: Hpt domain-containing protein [Oscillospiraceae bacterium]|nr:Hpt domain-containing protein [Oscillospiraceae bacterium]